MVQKNQLYTIQLKDNLKYALFSLPKRRKIL